MERLLKNATIFFIVIVLPLAVGIAAGGFFAFVRTVPSIEELKQQNIPPSTRIYADDDTLIGEIKVQKGIHVSLEKMPQDLLNAVVSVEDSNFWEHKGIDYLAIARAAIKDILRRHLKEGGSTITQQLAKITFLTPEKTIKRKIREAVLATRIERNLSKKEILELYLNRAYFGHGAYGVEMASKVYFGKSVGDLELPEAALIAGLLKAPNSYSPFRSLEKAKIRQKIVLSRMEEEGYINRKQKVEAIKSPIYLSTVRTGRETNNYFIDYVSRYLEEKYGADATYKGGMKVYTTLDRHAQLAAQDALQRGLRALDKRRGFKGPIEHREIDVNEELVPKGSFRSIPPDVGAIVPGLVLKVTKKEALVKASGLVGKLLRTDAEWARSIYDETTGETRELREDFSLEEIMKPGDVITVSVKSVNGRKAVFALDQEPDVQGAIVAIEPNTGFIRVIVGGYDHTRSEFNRAIRANRQPGSAFKPIIYSVALNQGFTPASVVIDECVVYHNSLAEEPEEKPAGQEAPFRPDEVLAFRPEGALIYNSEGTLMYNSIEALLYNSAAAMVNGAEDELICRLMEEMDKAGCDPDADPECDTEEEIEYIKYNLGYNLDDYWRPQNYDGRYRGPTRLRDALTFSRNVVSVKVVDTIGVRKVREFARAVGMEGDMPRDLTIALGSLTATPLDLTAAYSTFSNGGVKIEPIGIKYIIDRRGSVIENNEPEGKRVLDEQTAYLMTSMMQDVVKRGTGWRAKALRRPVAGKTGTTNDYRDAWFLGFTMDMIAGVWVGYDDMRPLGNGETGSKAASPIWVDFMKSISANYEPRDFPRPEGITTRMIDPKTGLLANGWTEKPLLEYFKEGTEPKEVAPSIWMTTEPDSLIFAPGL
jgi:membrane carboxypeptidase/penicillin-binding protein